MLACGAATLAGFARSGGVQAATVYPLTLTDVQWKSRLTPVQFGILRRADTEIPFTSPLLNEHRQGVFACAGCNQDLFSSKTKFESGTYTRSSVSTFSPKRSDSLGL
ncbi:MAG: peptide-methionine (R)-S-oxide reductase [Caulobacteraceae bacterium]